MNSYSTNIRIGFLVIQIVTDNPNFSRRLELRYQQFLENETEPDGCIEIHLSEEIVKDAWVEPELFCSETIWEISGVGLQGQIDQKNSHAEFYISPARTLLEVEYLIRIACAIWFFERGGVLFHGAALVRNGQAYLFTGHSGAGKTTVCRVTKDGQILNDDLVVLNKSLEGWEVWATPFTNPTQNEPHPGKGLLKNILKLHQAREQKIELQEPAIALADLITHIPVISIRQENLGVIMAICQDILKNVTAYNLYFLPNDQFWPLLAKDN